MPVKWRKTFKLWSQVEEHQRLVEKTRCEVRHLLEDYRCVVAFSGGKDSTVMLHLALQCDRDVQVFHWDHGSWLMPVEIEREILRNARVLEARNLLVKGSELLEKPEARSNWQTWYLVFWNTLAYLRRYYNWELQLVGLRREEGCKRSGKIDSPPYGEAYPLREWGWKDVWGYIIENKLPYPEVYDLYAKLLGYDKVRLVTFFDDEFEKFGGPYLDGFLMPEKRRG